MYQSPIEVIIEKMQTKYENGVFEAVQKQGIFVDKEELVKALQYDRGQYEKGYADGLRERNEWISVEERLPNPDKMVLVCKTFMGKPYTDIGYVKDAETCYCASDEYTIKPWHHKLTHWMPLPEPPKGE